MKNRSKHERSECLPSSFSSFEEVGVITGGVSLVKEKDSY
nr:MAG TPA: hypothetical protein [Caudoviricetes sp.]